MKLCNILKEQNADLPKDWRKPYWDEYIPGGLHTRALSEKLKQFDTITADLNKLLGDVHQGYVKTNPFLEAATQSINQARHAYSAEFLERRKVAVSAAVNDEDPSSAVLRMGRTDVEMEQDLQKKNKEMDRMGVK